MGKVALLTGALGTLGRAQARKLNAAGARTAAFALSKTVAPHMKARGYGKIINFCSVTLNGQWDGYTAYVASKGALLGLTKALARELGPAGVRVNAISPGAVVSEAEAVYSVTAPRPMRRGSSSINASSDVSSRMTSPRSFFSWRALRRT